MKLQKLYQIAIETRNLEINLFWQRSNYFLVLNTAIAVGFFSLKDSVYQGVLSLFGILVSFLWFRVNLGSKYWQSRWEFRAAYLESALSDNINLFAATRTVTDQDVWGSIGRKENPNLYDRAILSKPSVSKAMTLLSIIFILLWAGLLGISSSKLLWQ